MNIQRFLLSTLLLPLAFSSVLEADQDPFFSRNLPEPDHAEVMSVNPGSMDGPKVELDTKQAGQLAAMVRTQKYTGPAGACDKLQYILRFYANHQLVATEGICFHCGCLAPFDSDLHSGGDPLGFDTPTAKARALEVFLEKLFPAAK
jgi:Rieske Fe-S protein